CVRLELERRDDRTGMDLHDRALDRKLTALLLEEPCVVHQLALVDLTLDLGGVEQLQRRQDVLAFPPLGWRPRRFRWRRRGDGHFGWLWWREGARSASAARSTGLAIGFGNRSRGRDGIRWPLVFDLDRLAIARARSSEPRTEAAPRLIGALP